MILTRLAASFLVCACALLGAEEFRIALLCTGSITDGGWNQLAKEGIDQVARDLGANITVVQKVAQDKAGDEIRELAGQGYQLIIAHGYEYLTPAAEAAAELPAVKIAVSGADVAKPGIITLDFDLSHASYQAGMLAARTSKSGKLGFIGGAEIPSVKACWRGFRAGVLAVRPDASVVAAYTSWDQPAQNKSQAEAFLQQGIDVIYHDVDAASRGIFEAIAAQNKAQGAGAAWVIGSVADQNANSVCPDAILGSAVIKLGDTFAQVAKAVQAGTFTAGVIRENIALGTCVMVLNPRLVGNHISATIVAELDAVATKLIDGSVAIPAE